jgi:transposase
MSTITLGLDLGDRSSRFAVLDTDAHHLGEGSVATTREAMQDFFTALPTARVILEVGTHSPEVSRAGATGAHEVVLANPRRVRLISAAVHQSDRIDAVTLVRLGRSDPALLSPIRHRGETAQADLGQLRARVALVRTRTLLINLVQGTVKATGYRVPSSTARTFALRARTALQPALAPALASVVETIAHLTEQIAAADRAIAVLACERYPETARLRQIAGVGPITALCYVLTLEDPTRFAGSRSVGAYLGLCPRESQSGDRSPQLRITKAGDAMLRRLLATSAHYVLGPFGPDTDLRRWGLALPARGGANAKKRPVVTVARKLATLLHHFWVTDVVYQPLRQAA